jgi:hypothetical protein
MREVEKVLPQFFVTDLVRRLAIVLGAFQFWGRPHPQPLPDAERGAILPLPW